MRAWISRHPLASFYVAAYLYSWAVAVPLALQAQEVTATHLPFALHYLSAFGPALAALTVTMLVRAGRVDRESAGSSRPRAMWLAIGLASPLLLFGAAEIAGSLANQPTPGWTALGRVNFLPDLGPWAWGLWLLTSGTGEEIGWRGFALPHLQQRHSAFVSSLLLSMAWAGWHLPAFFYVPSYTAIGLSILPGFFIGILAGSIVLTWLYNSSGGNVLAAVLWHASFNYVTGSPNAAGLAAAVTSTLVIVWAAILLWRCGPATLTARSVKADTRERLEVLPGDEVIGDALASLTHAVTIRCPPRDVWPWIVQMGAGSRAGWYSYDFIDNGRRPSATRVVAGLQTIAVGTVFPALPGATDAFIVHSYDPEHHLVIGWPSAEGVWLMTWAFVLKPTSDGGTRLVVRARGGRAYQFHSLPWWLTKRIVPIGHFVMQRRQLVGIARRAEARAIRGFSAVMQPSHRPAIR